MSCIVDRDRGRSVLMSGIVWCYLESLVTTRLRAFHRISLSNQGQSRECGQVTRGLVRINDFYRVSHSRHHSSHHLWWEKTKSWQLRSKSILDICYGCSDQPQCIYLTPCVLATGETIYLVTDNTWGHGASLESGECQPHTSDCELISSDRDYVASKQWAPSYEAIGLTGDTLINTRLGK